MPRTALAAAVAALLLAAFAATASAECPIANCGPNQTAKTPNTSFLSGPANPTADTRPTFTFGSSLSFSRFECRWSSTDPWFECASGYRPPTAQTEWTHTLTVRACNDYETEDGVPFFLCDETPASWTYTIDITGPTAGFASGPAAGARLRTPPTYTFSGGAAPEGQAAYRCSLGTVVLGDCGSELKITEQMIVLQGPQNVRVQARDMLGNWGPVVLRQFVWDTEAPVVTVSGASTTSSRRPTLTYSAPRDDGKAYTFACELGGAGVPCGNGAVNLQQDLADGEHTIVVQATDEAGNSGQDDLVFAVDTTGPAVGDLAWDAQARRLTFAAGSDAATVKCAVGAGEFAACASPWSPGALAPGTHTLWVRVVDAVGNTRVAQLQITIPQPPPVKQEPKPDSPSGGTPPAQTAPLPAASGPAAVATPSRLPTAKPMPKNKRRATCKRAKKSKSKKAKRRACAKPKKKAKKRATRR